MITSRHALWFVSIVSLAGACSSQAEKGPPDGGVSAGGNSAQSVGSTSTSSAATTSATSGGGGMDGGPSPNDVYAYPPGSVVAGKTLAEWSAAWWQWALAIPKSKNPILDGPCDQNQPQGVFFLAGNTGGSSTRTCTVSSGAPIFFPIVNSEYPTCPEKDCGYDAAYVTQTADIFFDNHQPTSLVVEIDGVGLQGLDAYRAMSGLFDETQGADPAEQIFPVCGGPIGNNTCGIPVGSTRMSASTGYWVMLRPLSVGDHVVRFAGSYPFKGASFDLDVTYKLTVAP